MSKLSAQQIMDAGNISRTHAYDILGERQEPSLSLALKIYDKTGARFGILKGLADSSIADLRRQAA